MKLKEAQKSSTEPFESSESDLKIKNVNVHKTVEDSPKNLDFCLLYTSDAADDLTIKNVNVHEINEKHMKIIDF